MNDEQLVLLVKEYPNLYDLSHPKYHDNRIKDNTWDEIGKTIGYRAGECRNKWKSLRECYRKAIRNRETKSGEASQKMKAWRLESQMEFLRPFIMTHREQASNVDSTLEDDSKQIGDDSSETHEGHFLFQDATSGDSKVTSGTPAREVLTNESSRSATYQGPRKKQKTAGGLTPSAAVFKEYIEFRKSTRIKQTDHLTKYFQSVEETVRTFPPQLQVKIKSQISHIIHEAEFEALNMQSSSASNASHAAMPLPSGTPIEPIAYNLCNQLPYSSPPGSNVSSPPPSDYQQEDSETG